MLVKEMRLCLWKCLQNNKNVYIEVICPITISACTQKCNLLSKMILIDMLLKLICHLAWIETVRVVTASWVLYSVNQPSNAHTVRSWSPIGGWLLTGSLWKIPWQSSPVLCLPAVKDEGSLSSMPFYSNVSDSELTMDWDL